MKTPIVIRVHGTFAGLDYSKDATLDPNSWHASDSEFGQWIKKECQHSARFDLASHFDWGGDNFESARIHAAEDLLEVLHSYEKIKQPYHIIAHSHGGSVTWTALRLAETNRWRGQMNPQPEKNEPALTHLLSWATIGTPFVNAQRSWKGEFVATTYQILLLLLIGVVGYMSIESFVPALIKKFEWLNDPLFGMQFQWQLGANAIWGFIVFLLIVLTLIQSPILRFASLIANKRVKGATETYLKKWLDIECTQDEAIAGLKHAISLDRKIVSTMADRNVPYLWDVTNRLRGMLFFPVRFGFNLFVVPIANKYIQGRIKRLALGDDEPLYRVKNIQSSPLGEKIKKLAIPADIDQQLIDDANEALKNYVPKMREAVAAGVTAAGNSKLGVSFDIGAGEFSGSELIHTSYFDNEGVRKLLMADLVEAQCRFMPNLDDSYELGEPDVQKHISETTWVKEFHASVEKQMKTIPKKNIWFVPIFFQTSLIIAALLLYVYVVLTSF